MEYNQAIQQQQESQQKLKIPREKRVYNDTFKLEQKTFVPKIAKQSELKLKTVSLKTKDLDIEDQGKQIPTNKFVKTFNKNIQSGFQSKTKFQTEVIQDTSMPKIDKFTEKEVDVKADTINKFKETFRSGYQDKNTSNLVSDRQITMGVKEPKLIKIQKCQGATAYQVGWSGYIKESLKNKV